MRHRQKGKQLGRNIKKRQALFKGLIQNLIVNEQIKTTEAKAKAIKGLTDQLIVKAKKGSLSARRQVLSFLPDKLAVHKLFEVIGPRTQDRTSGFTRFVRLGRRQGDNAPMVRVELVDKQAPEVNKPKAKSAKTKS
jgi:large subunit ribosomal protein L17